MKERIFNLAKELKEELIRVRRHIHAHPELSFMEKNTSEYIQNQFDGMNVEISNGWAGYGMVIDLKGKNDDRMVALRADMDALPIIEANDVDYKSQNEGVMHACGHDVHSSVLIGAIWILDKIRAELGGSVRCIFQPGEEKLPGGASMMIQEGLFSKRKPEAMFGLHVHPPMKAGKVGIKDGLYMASADEIYISIKGKGGHAAIPQLCIDPILIAAEVVQGLQTVVSRKASPEIPSVVTIGKIRSVGGATNVIPNEVLMEGTFRTMDEKWRTEAHMHIKSITEGIAKAFGGEANVEIKVGYPCLVNDIELAQNARNWMMDYLGDKNVEDIPKRMSAEDFAFYTHHVPCCFYRLGIRNEALGIVSSVHTNTFDVDEECLSVGAGMMAWLAYQQLSH